jgi:hypothetical protein
MEITVPSAAISPTAPYLYNRHRHDISRFLCRTPGRPSAFLFPKGFAAYEPFSLSGVCDSVLTSAGCLLGWIRAYSSRSAFLPFFNVSIIYYKKKQVKGIIFHFIEHAGKL